MQKLGQKTRKQNLANLRRPWVIINQNISSRFFFRPSSWAEQLSWVNDDQMVFTFHFETRADWEQFDDLRFEFVLKFRHMNLISLK